MLLDEKKKELEKVAFLTKDQAKEIILSSVEKEYENDILSRINKIEKTGEERFLRKAQDILATIIQRLSNSVSADMLTTAVSIQSDEIKGKVS